MASTLLLFVSVTTASAADQNVWDQCNQTADTDASIAACMQILQAPDETTSNRAIAYYVRGGAYKAKGDNDHAIADYSKAIEAKPRHDARHLVPSHRNQCHIVLIVRAHATFGS